MHFFNVLEKMLPLPRWIFKKSAPAAMVISASQK
jgi:hypothetical protein